MLVKGQDPSCYAVHFSGHPSQENFDLSSCLGEEFAKKIDGEVLKFVEAIARLAIEEIFPKGPSEQVSAPSENLTERSIEESSVDTHTELGEVLEVCSEMAPSVRSAPSSIAELHPKRRGALCSGRDSAESPTQVGRSAIRLRILHDAESCPIPSRFKKIEAATHIYQGTIKVALEAIFGPRFLKRVDLASIPCEWHLLLHPANPVQPSPQVFEALKACGVKHVDPGVDGIEQTMKTFLKETGPQEALVLITNQGNYNSELRQMRRSHPSRHVVLIHSGKVSQDLKKHATHHSDRWATF